MHSSLSISQSDPRPMYLQIMEQIRRRIALGDWQAGQEIPSIRALAVTLKVSVITVKRAYLELEREGVISTRQGKGSFVADTVDLSRSLRREELDGHLAAAGRDRSRARAQLRRAGGGAARGIRRRRTAGTMSEHVVEFADVEKTYRFFQLRDISLRLAAGQIIGLVGPNGAGKSTTIRILMSLVQQDRGEVRVLGHSMPREQAAAKRDIGFVSEDMRLYGHATLAWHMRFVASIYPAWDATTPRSCCGASTCDPSSRSRGCHTASTRRPRCCWPWRAGRGCWCSTSRRPVSIQWAGTKS